MWSKVSLVLTICMAIFLLLTDMVVTYGNSMGPRITAGDLVFVRLAEEYVVGDAIAYHSTSMANVTVFHRIVDETPEGFVTQGDNNNFLDSDRPTPEDIIGVEWFVVPGAGKWLQKVTSPAFLGGVAFFLVITLWLNADGRRNRRRMRQNAGRAPLPDWM